jgi:hypothetical protein
MRSVYHRVARITWLRRDGVMVLHDHQVAESPDHPATASPRDAVTTLPSCAVIR